MTDVAGERAPRLLADVARLQADHQVLLLDAMYVDGGRGD